MNSAAASSPFSTIMLRACTNFRRYPSAYAPGQIAARLPDRVAALVCNGNFSFLSFSLSRLQLSQFAWATILGIPSLALWVRSRHPRYISFPKRKWKGLLEVFLKEPFVPIRPARVPAGHSSLLYYLSLDAWRITLHLRRLFGSRLCPGLRRRLSGSFLCSGAAAHQAESILRIKREAANGLLACRV